MRSGSTAPPFAVAPMTLISIVYHFAKYLIFGLKCPRLSFSFSLKAGGKVQEKQLSFCGVKLNMGLVTIMTFWFSVFKTKPEGFQCLVLS